VAIAHHGKNQQELEEARRELLSQGGTILWILLIISPLAGMRAVPPLSVINPVTQNWRLATSHTVAGITAPHTGPTSALRECHGF
jgi:hypothetical protein